MRYWPTDDLIRSTSVPLSAVSVVARVASCMPAADAEGLPRLVEIATRESEADTVDLRLSVELAPGLILSREYSEWDFEQALEVGGDHFAGNVLHDIERALLHIGSLQKLVRPLRRETRRLVARAQRQGLPLRLIRVSVLEIGAASDPGGVTFEAEIEGLGENLRPRRIILAFPPGRGLDETLTPVLADQRRLANTRSRMGRRGADGTIDALALAAVTTSGQLAEAFRGLAGAERFWLKDDTALLWKDGHVSSGSNNRADGLDWSGGRVTIEGHALPEIACTAAARRHVTDIVQGPLFDPSMTIRSARCADAEDGVRTALELDLPRMYLDLETLEAWPAP